MASAVVFVRQWLFLTSALLILGGTVGWNLYDEYISTDAQERERLVTQANVIDENLEHQLIATNHALDSIRRDLPRLKAQKDGLALINRRLDTMRDAMPTTRAITLFDAGGTLIARSPDQFVGQNFSNREYFQAARQGGNPDTLYVAQPFLAATGDYVLNVSKVLLDDRGVFAGVILVSLGPEYFSTLLRSVLYAPDMRSAVVHGDGKIVFTVPDPKSITGMDMAARPGAFFTQHMKSGRAMSVFSGSVASTGEARLVVIHTFRPAQVPVDKPLVIAVNREIAVIFGPWRQDIAIHGGLFVLLALATTLGLHFHQKRQRVYDRYVADQEAERKLADIVLHESQNQFRKVVEESPLAMALVDMDGTVEYINRKAIETFGYLPQDIPNMDRWWVQAYPDEAYRAEVIARWMALVGEAFLHHREIEKHEYRVTCKDGSVKTVIIFGVWVADKALVIFEDITQRLAAEAEIKNLAFYDPLTGLPNRRLLHDRLRQALASSTRSARYGALLFLDLDNFKTLNDTLGHDIGDLLLQQVAQRLSTCVREGDTVARLGGDEFVVMLEDLSENVLEAAAQTETVGEKILVTLNQIYQLGQYEHHSTPSIGVTLFADHQGSMDDLLKRADLAMYQAKAAGRNTLRFFDPEMQAVVTTRAALEADLREAVRKGQFVLYYQAQVDGMGRLTGVEVLLRWQHPLRGLVSPLEFIPLAEDTGLILPLGHWVLETACAQLTVWATRPEMAHLTIAVNVSARQFHHVDFVDQVLAVLDKTGANPKRLKLELTESLLVEDVEGIIIKMTALKARGVCFSLDDFGTGYSSLSYLKRLPLDQLKIDQSFVRDILIDTNDSAIAKMVVALAESMGLAVIAEGVETEAQKDFLARNGCLAYQGYLYSRPLPLGAFEDAKWV
jgi:diguanylate cyclase (GGDEF)-like protein/PAS domain S-box-containing protein